MMPRGFVRVSRSRPCPICTKPDFCLLSRDGQHAGCTRTQAGCDRDHHGREIMVCREIPTYRFTVDSSVGRSVSLEPADERQVYINAGAIHRQCVKAIATEQIHELACDLGVAVEALEIMGCGWHKQEQAYSFPMYDHAAKIIGIRLRKPDGRKYAVRGSKQGVFLPVGAFPRDDVAIFVEGPTDAAALVTLGIENVFGLPSISVLSEFVRKAVRFDDRNREWIYLADADAPGQEAAARFAAALVHAGCPGKVIVPPGGHKDMRAWLNAGATRAKVLAAFKNAMYWSPRP
jgi:hypothetical protein